jgi:hypothetical protein
MTLIRSSTVVTRHIPLLLRRLLLLLLLLRLLLLRLLLHRIYNYYVFVAVWFLCVSCF